MVALVRKFKATGKGIVQAESYLEGLGIDISELDNVTIVFMANKLYNKNILKEN